MASGPVAIETRLEFLHLAAGFSLLLGLTMLATGVSPVSAAQTRPIRLTVAVVSRYVRATLVPNGLSLRSGAPASMAALVINNGFPRALRLVRVRSDNSSQVIVHVEGGGAVIDSGATVVLAVGVRAREGAAPQNGSAILRLTIAPVDGTPSVELAIADPVEIQAPTQDALLLALGIPGLVFVPGFLLLVTMSALWRLRLARQWWDREDFPVPVPSPEFWVGAVTLSIVVALLVQRAGLDLLNSYSLRILLWVWLLALGAGAVGYLALIIARNARHASRTPATGDDQVAVLRKLHRQGLTSRCERYQTGGGEDGVFLYLLQRPDESRERSWLAPAIEYEWQATEDKKLKDKVSAFLNETHDAGGLAKALNDGKKRDLVSIAWAKDRAANYKSPILLATEGLEAHGAREIVREKA